MAGARIHRARPRQARRAPIETILQAAAVHVGFKGMAKVFDFPPIVCSHGLRRAWCASEQPSRRTYLVLSGHVPSPKLPLGEAPGASPLTLIEQRIVGMQHRTKKGTQA